MLFSSGLGTVLEQRPGCIRHRGGATGPREARAALRPQEDYSYRHDQTLTPGIHTPLPLLTLHQAPFHKRTTYNMLKKIQIN